MEDIDYKPTSEELSVLKAKWSKKIDTDSNPQTRLLSDMAAYFMLSNLGRGSNLFEGRSAPFDNNCRSQLDNSQANHLYLAQIGIVLLDRRDPGLLEIVQLLNLISDYDLIALGANSHQYKGDYEGVRKFAHPDFQPLRISAAEYGLFAIDNPDFYKEIIHQAWDSTNRTNVGSSTGMAWDFSRSIRDAKDRLLHVIRYPEIVMGRQGSTSSSHFVSE